MVRRSFWFRGTLTGLLCGVLWWVGLVVAFGISDGKLDLSLLLAAPLVAIPWAVVGLIAGGVSSTVPGPWVPVCTGLGTAAGGALVVLTSPFDGWLAVTMPISCLGGALAGVAVGAIVGLFVAALRMNSSQE